MRKDRVWAEMERSSALPDWRLPAAAAEEPGAKEEEEKEEPGAEEEEEEGPGPAEEVEVGGVGVPVVEEPLLRALGCCQEPLSASMARKKLQPWKLHLFLGSSAEEAQELPAGWGCCALLLLEGSQPRALLWLLRSKALRASA
jgi:hypothetical protein